jgi:hypothetical protein
MPDISEVFGIAVRIYDDDHNGADLAPDALYRQITARERSA